MFSGINNGSKPDFIGLGAQRAGTTWLYKILKNHPEICTASGRKEVHYFDRYYERGLDWYLNLFAGCPDSSLKGEITPAYLFHKDCPSRIKEVVPDAKFVVILRNPIERAYSQFKYHIRETGYSGSFEDFLSATNAKPRGLYYQQLERYLTLFNRSQFLILIFEEMVSRSEQSIESVFNFLEVDNSISPNNLDSKANYSAIPRFHQLYTLGKKLTTKLHNKGFSKIVNILKKTGIKRLFFPPTDKPKDQFPPLKSTTRKKLEEYFFQDIKKLSKLLNRNILDFWDYE